MPPPELAGDAPVADAFQPGRVVLAPALGHEPQGSVSVGLRARAGPAAPSARTTDRTAEARSPCRSDSSAPPHAGAAPPAPAGRRPRTPPPPGAAPRSGPAPGSGRGAARLIRASGVMMSMLGSSCRRPISKSSRIVRRGDLHGTGAELGIHRVVGHDGDQAVHQRQHELPADEAPVALVLRVHRDRGVAQHGLGPGGGDGHVAAAVGERIAKMPELAVHLLLLHLFVGESGEAAGAPVDDVVAAVDQALARTAARKPPAPRGRAPRPG